VTTGIAATGVVVGRSKPRFGQKQRRGTATLALILVTLVALYPLVILVLLSLSPGPNLPTASTIEFSTLRNVYTDPDTWSSLATTMEYTVGGALLALIMGGFMAFAVQCVDIPFRRVLPLLPVVGLLIPELTKQPAFIMAFSPKTGLLNLWFHDLFHTGATPFNVYSVVGLILVSAVLGAPVSYMLLLAPFANLDRSMLEAARTSGAGSLRTILRIVLPSLQPALLSAYILQLLLIGASFELALVIGLPGGVHTYIGAVYEAVISPTQGLNIAAALGTMYLLITAILVAAYILATRREQRFALITGKGSRPLRFTDKRAKVVAVVGIVAYSVVGSFGPLILTGVVSFLPFYSASNGNPFHSWTTSNYTTVLQDPEVQQAFVTSTWVAVFTVIGALIVGGFLSFISVKSKLRARRLADVIGIGPASVPPVIYSVGLLVAVLSIPALASFLYGSTLLMVLMETLVYLPFVTRLLSGSLIQIDGQLTEAAQVSGAGWLRTLTKVILPLMASALVFAACLVFIFSYRELGAVVLLVAANKVLVPYVTYSFLTSGGLTTAAALNVLTLIVPAVFTVIGFAVAGRSRKGRKNG
jgi:iron(III) transport system permease protein